MDGELQEITIGAIVVSSWLQLSLEQYPNLCRIARGLRRGHMHLVSIGVMIDAMLRRLRKAAQEK